MTKVMKWPCRLYGETTASNHRKIRIYATIEGMGDVHGAIRSFVGRKKNSYEWLGVELTAITPLGQTVKHIYEG